MCEVSHAPKSSRGAGAANVSGASRGAVAAAVSRGPDVLSRPRRDCVSVGGVIEWLYLAAQAAALALAAWFFVDTARSKQVGRANVVGVVVLEALLLAQLVTAIVLVPGAAGDGKAMLFSYIVTTLLVPIAALFWGSIDRSRWGIGTVAFSCLIVAALMLRVHQIWEYQVDVVA